MRSYIIILLATLHSLLVIAQQPSFEWAVECGNPPGTTDAKTALSADNQGGFYFAGEFIDEVTFDPKTLLSAGGTDIFAVKLNADGTYVHAFRLGGLGDDFLQEITADHDGNIIVAGYFYGTTQIGTDTYTSYGSQDIFVAKYNPGGDFLWSFRAGGAMADYCSGVSIDDDGNIILAGHFYGEISFGDTSLTATAGSDVYLARLSPDGELHWTAAAGGTSSDQARSVSCDPSGNILLAGSFYYNITLGDTTLVTSDPVGVFISRFSPGGDLDWAFQLNGSYLTTDIKLVPASNGGFYISGNFSETIYFGNQTFQAGPFNQDIYIAKYNPAGTLAWARHAFSDASDEIIGIRLDINDNLYLTGHYMDAIHFGSLILPYTLCCGSREIFMVNYSHRGEILWAEQISGAYASVHSLAVNHNGNMLLSGWFTGDIVFGPLSLNYPIGYHNYLTGVTTEMNTSVPSYALHLPLKLYPNPAYDRVSVLLTGSGRLELILYDVSGRILLKQYVADGDVIDLSGLPAGYYLYRASDKDNATHSTGKVIRQP